MVIVLGVGLSVSGFDSRLLAQTNDPSGASAVVSRIQADPYSWFQIGELIFAIATQPYNFTVADSIKEKYQGLRDLLVSVHSSEATLNAFDVHTRAVLQLPWRKSYAYWTDEEKARWDNGSTWKPIMNALAADQVHHPDANYFFWLGYQSNQLGWYIPYRQDDGSVTSEYVENLRTALHDYLWLGGQAGGDPNNARLFKQLRPEIQTAINTIVSKKSILEGSSDVEISMKLSDLDQMVQAARTIRRAAKDKTLVQ